MRAVRGNAPLAAYVLHQWDWSETSLIVELFTRERGRIAVAAKGAKRPTSNFRAVLLPFNRLIVQLGKAPADGEAELFNLRGAEWSGGIPFTGGAALFAGFYANELLMKLLPRQDPHGLLFDAYAATLPALMGDSELPRQAALRSFELLLLRELGWLPDLGSVTQTLQPVDAAAGYGLDPEFGVVRGHDDAIPGATLRRLQAVMPGGDLAALRDVCSTALPMLQTQLRHLLQYHLGSSQLRTRQVLLGARRLQGQSS